MNDLEKLFLSELRNMHHGERQLVEALSELEKNTPASALQESFYAHRQEEASFLKLITHGG